MTQHTVGAVLTSLRQHVYQDNYQQLACDLAPYGVQLWYYQCLERSSVTYLSDSRVAMLSSFYQFSPAGVRDFMTTPDLSHAIQEALAQKETLLRWHNRRENLPWPDSDRVARQLHQQPVDPAATYRYADMMRYIRLITQQSVAHAARYFAMPDLLYWQMETAQIPMADDILDWLRETLNTDDLSQFMHAHDFDDAMRRAISGPHP